ncbi:hypothetical protein S7711_10008 [Stachybotrys chartarum IBT 7711]|uniref:SDR family NAD(P)-dependent oxidoreductase n=1 Tax=Stachybotrys chartarum (strain CBS 109288 / IBT 7711) TaxID=1280523 RepID=A0A084ALT6_STACB|nr:hypothetical protein S7711_10008 [Stachybotrys chartarum IBT 7711]
MVHVFITGSSDGIGLATAQLLASRGHRIVLHVRNAARASTTRAAVPKAEAVLVGDLSPLAKTKKLAADADTLEPSSRFDVVIHNAGIGFGTASRATTSDGLTATFAVNTAAPYVLTCLMRRPTRGLPLRINRDRL